MQNYECFSLTPFDTTQTIVGPAGGRNGSGLRGFSLRIIWGPEDKFGDQGASMQEIIIEGETSFRLAEPPGQVWLWRPNLSLTLDLEKREGEVRLSHPRDWENVLRFIYFHLLIERRGLLLHASSLARNGSAYVFPGPSGVGKTSIVQNSSGMLVLTDELAAVGLPENGSPPLAYGTPFYGDWGKPGENLAAPLKGLYFPVQDRKNFVTPLSPSETLDRLLPCVCTYTTRKDLLNQLVDLAVLLAQRVPGFALHFRPEPALWQAIDGS